MTSRTAAEIVPEVEVLAGRVRIPRRGKLVAVAEIYALRPQARQRIDLHVAGTVNDTVIPGLADTSVGGCSASMATGITPGVRATGASEGNGIFDLLLAEPVARSRLSCNATGR